MNTQAAAHPGGVPRFARGPAPLLLGMVLFIASETMFFGALFGAYFTLRGETAVWPPAGARLDLVEMSIATAILLGSSVPAHLAAHALRDGAPAAAVRRLLLAAVMGVAFLGLKLHDWATAGFSVASHAYGTIFFTLTGFHALHMVAGIILLAGLAAKVAGGHLRPETGGADAVIYYWHFVDAVWLAVFSTIWLIR